MGHLATRARATGILSLCLLLLSSLGASGALAAPAPPQTAAPAAAALVFGTGSCVGTNACFNAVGPIGDNSCIGDGSCATTTGAIGDNSCLGVLQCQNAGPVGDNSCASGFNACIAAPSVGDSSCNGAFDGCQAATVGHDSCDGSGQTLCYHATVGNYSCNSAVNNKCTYGTLGDCVNNDVTPSVCFQPDGRIRRIGKHNMVGNDIYNTDGTNQTLTDTLGDRAVRFVITIQNDGLTADSFTVGSSNGIFAVALPPVNFYHGWPATDITATVMAGTYTTPTIAPGGVYRIRAVVRPSQIVFSHLAAGPGIPHYSWLVTATSVGNPSQKDAVRFAVDVPFN
jgi:hypothetical protein